MPCKLCSGDARVLYDLGGYRLYRCEACGIGFVDPFLTDEQTARVFDALYHPNGAGAEALHPVVMGQYAAHSGASRLSADRADYLRLLSGHCPGGRLLDVGCGTGSFLKTCREAGWEVEGVELSPEAVAVARDKYGLVVYQGKLQDIGLPQSSCDAVTMLDFFEHAPDPLRVLTSARRVLKPSGILFLALPNFDGLINVVGRAVYSMSLGLLRGHLRILYPVTHLFHYTPRSLRHLLEQAGFSVAELRSEGTDLASLPLNPLLRAALKLLFSLSRLAGRENRMLIVARAV